MEKHNEIHNQLLPEFHMGHISPTEHVDYAGIQYGQI
jgi:hypothetical protein